jgi:hypothetical protein
MNFSTPRLSTLGSGGFDRALTLLALSRLEEFAGGEFFFALSARSE